jgi:hypothetical protein
MLSSGKRTETEKLASLLVNFFIKNCENFSHFVKKNLEKKEIFCSQIA